MINIFISQPMNGKTEQQILSERDELKKIIVKYYSVFCPIEQVYFLDTFILGAENVDPLFCLGYSITMLSKATTAVFADGWLESRGCNIEWECCKSYRIGMKTIETMKRELASEGYYV